MKPLQPDNRIRPGFVALLVCAFVATLLAVWAFTKATPTPSKDLAAPSATNTTATATPAPRQQLVWRRIVPLPRGSAVSVRAHMQPPPVPPVSRWVKRHTPATRRPAGPVTTPEERWGIQVCGVETSMGNTMLDLRYKVIDLEKATMLSETNAHAYLIDPVTGTKLFLPAPPKEGAFPPGGPRLAVGRTYFAAVANPHGALTSGRKVNLVVGDSVLPNLTID